MILPTLLSLPVKSLVPYEGLSLATIQIIGTVISNDEGGWVSTQEPDGSDGGWTYGGMTARKFSEYYPQLTSDEFIRLRVDPQTVDALRKVIICIYYQDYMSPVAKNLSRNDRFSAAHLSCAMNLGIGGFLTVYRCVTANTSFLSAWKDYYFTIVKNNPGKMMYIHGWINRVFRYAENP